MGWAEDYARQKAEQERKVRLKMARHMDIDPDTAGRVFGVAAVTGLPNKVVAADLDNLESKLKVDTFDYEAYTDEESGSPIFNKFASEDPYNLAVLERDRKHMTRMERAADIIDLGWDAGWGTVEMAEIVDRQLKGEEREEDAERLEHLEKLVAGGDFGADSGLLKSLVWTANQLPIQGWIVKESADEIVGMSLAYGAGALAAGQMGPQVAVPEEAITVPGAMAMGARHGFVVGRTRAAFKLERGLAYNEYRSLGLNEQESRTAANMVGVVNAMAESIGIGALTKRLPGFSNMMKDRTGIMIGKIFKAPTFRQGLARATLMYGEAMATEVATEIVQESMTIAGGEWLKSRARAAGDNRPELRAMSGEEYVEAVKQIAVQTMYGTSIIGAMGPVWQLRADAKRARDARQSAHAWWALGEGAMDSQTRETATEAWKEWVQRMQAEGPVKEVRIKSDGWRSYWQSQKIDPDKAAEELGIDLEKVEATDTDLVVPFDAFVDQIAASDHMKGLTPHLRFREGDMTLRESEDWHKAKDVHVAEVEKALAKEFGATTNEEIEQDLKGQLIGAGYNEKAAGVMARLHAAVMTTTAMREGMDPMTLYQQRLKGINREVPESMRGGDVDMEMDPIIENIRAGRYPKQREIRGASLMDLIRESGLIRDDGGELAARDFAKAFPGVMSKEGRSLDDIAEIAAEQGYITERDEGLLLEAIDRELAGTPVFSRTAQVNVDLEEMLALMEAAAEWFDTEGFDLQNMSNADVRAAILGIKSFEQSSMSDLEAWTKLVGLAMDYDASVLAKAEMTIPRVAEEQDFSSVEFTDKFVTPEGKTGTYTVNAQDAYDEAVNDRNALKQLLDCVNG